MWVIEQFEYVDNVFTDPIQLLSITKKATAMIGSLPRLAPPLATSNTCTCHQHVFTPLLCCIKLVPLPLSTHATLQTHIDVG